MGSGGGLSEPCRGDSGGVCLSSVTPMDTGGETGSLLKNVLEGFHHLLGGGGRQQVAGRKNSPPRIAEHQLRISGHVESEKRAFVHLRRLVFRPSRCRRASLSSPAPPLCLSDGRGAPRPSRGRADLLDGAELGGRNLTALLEVAERTQGGGRVGGRVDPRSDEAKRQITVRPPKNEGT